MTRVSRGDDGVPRAAPGIHRSVVGPLGFARPPLNLPPGKGRGDGALRRERRAACATARRLVELVAPGA